MGPEKIQAALVLLADLSTRIAELRPVLTAMLPPSEAQPFRVIEGGRHVAEPPEDLGDEVDHLRRMIHGDTA